MEDTRNQIIENRQITTKENIKIFIQKNFTMFLIVIGYVAFATIFNFVCPIRFVIRRPCPACGITRAWAQALQLNLKEALHFHPLFWFVPFYFCIVINREIWPVAKIPTKIYTVFAVLGGILIFGVYIFRNIVGFGGI